MHSVHILITVLKEKLNYVNSLFHLSHCTLEYSYHVAFIRSHKLWCFEDQSYYSQLAVIVYAPTILTVTTASLNGVHASCIQSVPD
jgi:hypothetical protein